MAGTLSTPRKLSRAAKLLACFVLAWLALALSSRDAAARPPEPSPWLEKPVRLGEISEKDRIAREHLLNSLNEKQEDEFRREWEVVIPELPTGLPDDYDILIFGQHVGIALLRLEIQVRGRHANAELVTVAGIRRGELPAAECDDLARQTAYAFQAEQKRRRTERGTLPPSLRYRTLATHARRQRLEVVSRDRLMRFHLRTEAWQTRMDTVSARTAGVPGFAHAQASQTLEQMARERLPLIEPSDELRRELVSRLQRIPEPTVESKPTAANLRPRPSAAKEQSWESMRHATRLRDDLAAIEVQLYARLAVEWACKDALAELRRLKLDEPAARLELVTAADPIERLQALLAGESWELFRWGLDFAAHLPAASQRELLLDSLNRRKNGFEVGDVLDRLRLLKPSEDEYDTMRRLYLESDDLRTKIAAAGFLLDRRGEDEYYDYLRREALQPEDKKDDVYAPQRLLTYLRAVDLETRTRAALDFAKSRRLEAAWLRDVGRRLVADGAAPESCDPFLHPEAHRPPEPQGRSIEGTHW